MFQLVSLAFGQENNMLNKIKNLISRFKKWIIWILTILGIIGVASISILNVHSHPQVGDNWAVSFETTGLRDLIITPDDQNTINDLDFVSLKCGDEERVPQILENDVIFYPNWFCITEGQIVHIVNIARKHILKFQFGNEIKYAYNSPDTEILRPNSTESQGITYLQNSTHHGAVSDENDATWVKVAGAIGGRTQYDRYGLPSPSGSGVITNVRVWTRAWQHWTNITDGHVREGVRIGGGDYYGSWHNLSVTGVKSNQYTDWANNPNTSSAWTWQNIIDLEIWLGLKEDDVNYNVYCSEVWIVITYTVPIVEEEVQDEFWFR